LQELVMELLKSAIAVGAILAVLDLVWLGVIAKDWLAKQLGPLMREKIMPAPAILFYLLYAVGLAFFAVQPSLGDGDWMRALGVGAFFGLVAYGTYDLTNLATIKGWPAPMVVVDLVWGAVLSGVSAAGAVLVLKQFGWA